MFVPGTIYTHQVHHLLGLVTVYYLHEQLILMLYVSGASHLLSTMTLKGCCRNLGRAVQSSRYYSTLLQDFHILAAQTTLLCCRFDTVCHSWVHLHQETPACQDLIHQLNVTATGVALMTRVSLDLQTDTDHMSPKNDSLLLHREVKGMMSKMMKVVAGGTDQLYIRMSEPHHHCNSSEMCQGPLPCLSLVVCGHHHCWHLALNDLRLWTSSSS